MSKKRGAHSFLVLQDQGTYGLTGRVLRPDELEADLPVEERWGRFENLAFNWDYSLVAPVFHYCFNAIPDLRTRLTARRIALIHILKNNIAMIFEQCRMRFRNFVW
jgi:hypothetical protein